jgi:ABC-2 family transporter protein
MTEPAVAARATATAARPVSVARAFRFELVKQLAQWRVRLLILACLLGPAIAVIVVSGQSTLPSDTLFGREMHATGWAGALVVLSFAGSWFFPLLTSVVAGDVFSSEDRLGTWRHLLVAVRSPRRIFLAKALAILAVLAMCVPGLAVSGVVGGLVVGSRTLTASTVTSWHRRTPPGSCCWRGSARSPRSLPSPRSGCSRPSSSGAPRSGCCCPRSAGWACSWRPRCFRCRPPPA